VQVEQSFASSLEHLGVEHLDSYVLHGPTMRYGLAPDDWEAWVQNQQTLAPSPTDPLAQQGEELFLNPLSDGRGACTACHAVGDAGGAAAPNLSHFADPTHTCFAGCNWSTEDREALAAWLAEPGAEKLGAKMPDYQLTDEEIDALVAYLYSLT